MSEGALVLIVDDEPGYRILLAELVRLQGYRPLLASGGAEALALIQQNAVDVVLLDIGMPGMGGLEVLEQLAAQGLTPALPVLMVSGLADHKSRMAAMDGGATDFLCKPIDQHELAARLRIVIQLKSLRDQVQSRLRDSVKLHQALMAGAAVPIVVLDLNGCVVEANAAAESLYEVEFGPLLGLPYSSLVVAEDEPRSEQALLGLLRTGVAVLALPLRVPGRGGREVHLDVSASLVETERGRLVMVVGRDVTEERRAQRQLAQREEELQRAVEMAAQRARRLDLLTARLPLVLWEDELRDGVSVCRWVSENVERVLGVSADALVSNNNWLSYVHPEDRSSLVRPLRLDTANQWLEEYRWCRPDGSVIYLNTGVSSVQADGARFLIGFALDVSESRKLAAVLLQAQKMEAIGQITGGIAHDFNNLLTVIQSFATFVHDELPEGDARRDDINQVLAASDKAIALSRQLLAFSRPQVSVSRPLDLNHCLTGLLKMLRRCVGEDIEVQLAASARPAIVRLDPVHLDQLMMNLAVNARDAMPDGGQLNLTVSHASESGDLPSARWVRLVVRDTGSGMEPATLARIFDPFFTTKEVGKGTGLGLATCYGLVKEAGGIIRVDSAPGAGTAFTIDFPVCDEPLEDSLETKREGLQTGRDRRVLVVEDDHPVRMAAVRILESAGYRVSQARDGDEAIQRIDELGHELELIFSDVVLPGRGGYAVAEYARLHAPGVLVVLTSGYLDRQVAAPDKAQHLPLLWKPYTAGSLLRAVDSALLQGPVKDRLPSPDPIIPAQPLSHGYTPALVSAGAILLVADDRVQRETYARALRSSGFGVTTAESGEEAVELLERLSFDAVASDIGLPGMDGMAVLRAVRAIDAQLPALLMTSTPSVETAAMAVNSRAFGYLVKPISLEVLVQEVGRAVEAGQVARLQRKLLAARGGADEFLLDLPATRRRLDAALRRLHMVFQPIVRSHDGSIFGYEALLRSDEPTLNTPQKVIAAADVLGRTDEVGLAVRSAIAVTLAQHPEQMEAIFVNLHPGELRSQLLCAVTEPLRRRAAKVVLEVTERASLSVGPATNEEVRRLREAGYRLAIDDLGESHAGLSWMSHLRPDIAKIDMSLVRGAPQSPLKREILASLINVCRGAAITVVAEGLETEEEVRLLTDLGCELLQGYYFSRPGPAFPEVRQLFG